LSPDVDGVAEIHGAGCDCVNAGSGVCVVVDIFGNDFFLTGSRFYMADHSGKIFVQESAVLYAYT
jgi:hypothetical protein